MKNPDADPDVPQTKSLRVDWRQWLATNAVITRSPPADGPYRVTVVVTTDLPHDHPQLATLLEADRIVIDIETFTDGRVFGLARLLRDDLGFAGDLEVSGDFLPDQISFLERCGVNAFSGEELVRDAFNFYSGFYQPPRAGIDEVSFIREVRDEPQTA
jgi:uncharacterized protein (DUF934 family)